MYFLNTPSPSNKLSYLGKLRDYTGDRPNQSVTRGWYYYPRHTTTRQLRGLGQMPSTSTLLLGAAAVGLGWFLLRGKKSGGARRIARLASDRARASLRLKELGA